MSRTTTGNPCVDLFFRVVPGTATETLTALLENSYAYSPITTLKLIFNLRANRGAGKHDKESFFTAVLWLYKHHPKTLADNVASIVLVGSFEDLPEILLRITQSTTMSYYDKCRYEKYQLCGKARKLYENDYNYKYLFRNIRDLFIKQFEFDLELLQSGNLKEISLAAKLFPLYSILDMQILLGVAVGIKMLPNDKFKNNEWDSYNFSMVRDYLKEKVIDPLCKALEEKSKTPVKSWWCRVLGCAPVKSWWWRILGCAEEEVVEEEEEECARLLPHEIVTHPIRDLEAAENKWRRMVRRLSEKGKLKNSLVAISYSMEMMYVAEKATIALALLLSELTENEDCRISNNLVALYSNPRLFKVDGQNNLEKRIEILHYMGRRPYPVLHKVFDLLLHEANGFKHDQMFERVFVLGDMEFCQAAATKNERETDYEAIARKFTEKGLRLPKVVFWNLMDSKATPVTAIQPGVALVSGFSENLITLFLEDDKTSGNDMNPEKFMEKAIASEEYGELRVVD